jgi:hypothetical protein
MESKGVAWRPAPAQPQSLPVVRPAGPYLVMLMEGIMTVARRALLAIACTMMVFAAAVQAVAQVTPVPVDADQAFNAVQLQRDPVSGDPKIVYLVDIRSRAEFYWVGTAAEVTQILLWNDQTVVPDHGKVKLVNGGKFIQYRVHALAAGSRSSAEPAMWRSCRP